MVCLLFFDANDSPIDAFAEAKPVAWFYETAHIERLAVYPFLIVDVAVQVAGFVECKAVQVAMVDCLAVQTEGDLFHSVDVGCVVHIVIGFDRQSDLSPCFELAGNGLLAVFGRDRF